MCDSRFLWAKDCPDAFENNEASNLEEYERNERVQLSLFIEYTERDKHMGKLSTLTNEAKSCAVLDTECSITVGGNF